MNVRHFVASLVIAGAALLVVRPAASRAVEEPADPLAPLAWTVGGKWVGRSEGVPTARRYSRRRRLSWAGHQRRALQLRGRLPVEGQGHDAIRRFVFLASRQEEDRDD